MRVRCVKNQSGGVRHALTKGQIYEVIGVEAGDYRILDDSGGPVLFDLSLFKIVDRSRPDQWETRYEDGVEYSYASELGAPGFFESFHERDPKAVRTFHQYINRHLRITHAA